MFEHGSGPRVGYRDPYPHRDDEGANQDLDGDCHNNFDARGIANSHAEPYAGAGYHPLTDACAYQDAGAGSCAIVDAYVIQDASAGGHPVADARTLQDARGHAVVHTYTLDDAHARRDEYANRDPGQDGDKVVTKQLERDLIPVASNT